MARVCYNPVCFLKFRPSFHTLHQPSLLIKTSIHYQHKTRKSNPAETETDIVIKSDSSVTDSDSTSNQSTSSSTDAGFIEFPNKEINASTLSALGLFLFTRLDFGVSLKDLSAAALPYEQVNCLNPAAKLGTIITLRDRVNFVTTRNGNKSLMSLALRVIVHFAFLDRDGNEEGNVVGRLPRQYLLENLDALARREASIPHARIVGQYSSAENRKVHQVVDPRSHGYLRFQK